MRDDRDGPAGVRQRRARKALETGTDEVVAVYCAPDREGRPVDPIKAFALEKGLPVHQPASFQGPSDAGRACVAFDADLMRHGLRHRVRAGSGARHAEAGLDLLSPIAPAAASGAELASTGRSSWAARKTGFSWFYPTDGLDEGDDPFELEVRNRPGRHRLGDLYFKKIFPLPSSPFLKSRPLPRPAIRPHRTGRKPGDLRALVHEEACGDRLAQACKPGIQSDPRHQSAAGCLDNPWRHRAQHLRQRARRWRWRVRPGDRRLGDDGITVHRRRHRRPQGW